MFSLVNDRLDQLLMHGGSIVDVSIIQTPSSARNAKGERDPETRQTKKGGRRHFGMKVHAAVDAGVGHAVAATFAPRQRPRRPRAVRARARGGGPSPTRAKGAVSGTPR